MLGGKATGEPIDCRRSYRAVGQRYGKLIILTGIAHIDRERDAPGVRFNAPLGKPPLAAPAQFGDDPLDLANCLRRQPQ